MALTLAIALSAVLAVALALAVQRARRLRRRAELAEEDLERLQNSFSRFTPEEVVENVIARGVSTQGEYREVTALFADIVSYTALSESVDPTTLLRILNGYFRCMSDAITEHRGHVSSFVGDGILALFGSLRPNPWQANDAVHAALAMRDALARYNLELADEGLPTLSVGIGIHRGTGVTGLVGSRELMQFAFVGRIVNLAARIQELTRQHGVDILLTDAVRADLDARFKLGELPAADVRGVAEAVAIFAVQEFQG